VTTVSGRDDDPGDDYVCCECGAEYSLHDGCDPTPECDSCAHDLLQAARHSLGAALALAPDAGRALLAVVAAARAVMSRIDHRGFPVGRCDAEARALRSALAALDGGKP
jgi:DNA-directed RNA polymerase subunit RPC12/RpoP